VTTRTQRTALALAVVLALLIGVVSCMELVETKNKVTDGMLAYLEHKYQQPFEVKHFMRGTRFLADNRNDEAIVAPAGRPEQSFSVLRIGTGSDASYQDGFAYILAEDEIKGLLDQQVHKVFGPQALWSVHVRILAHRWLLTTRVLRRRSQ
jgi:hypothetical protein